RFLYWADTLGLLVWEEMPSAYRFTRDSVRRLCEEWTAVVERDYSHPCIISWVPINESWGVPNLPDSANERHYVQALYHLTKTFDATRPVIGNDGWESVATDIIGIHDYDSQPDRMARRYHADEVLPRLFRRERPGGRLLVLGDQPPAPTGPMNKVILRKADGRGLILYARDPITPGFRAPSPSSGPFAPNAHLRWHPLRGEWVAYATHRQDRTFLPAAAANPLAP